MIWIEDNSSSARISDSGIPLRAYWPTTSAKFTVLTAAASSTAVTLVAPGSSRSSASRADASRTASVIPRPNPRGGGLENHRPKGPACRRAVVATWPVLGQRLVAPSGCVSLLHQAPGQLGRRDRGRLLCGIRQEGLPCRMVIRARERISWHRFLINHDAQLWRVTFLCTMENIGLNRLS